MGKSLKLLFLLILLIFNSCMSERISDSVWKQIEIEDDNICMSAGIDYNSQKNRVTYWRCRIRIIDQRIYNESINSSGSVRIGDLKRAKRAMNRRIKKESEKIKLDIEIADEEKEHSYCIILGEKMAKIGQSFNYFECRNELDIKKRANSALNLENLSNERIFNLMMAKNLEKTDKSNKKNGDRIIESRCVKYITNDEQYQKCLDELEELKECMNGINKKLKARNISDEMYCLNRSIEKYPDTLAVFNAGQDSGMMMGPRIDKFDLIELRDKEYENCKAERSKKLDEYRLFIESECEKLVK